MYKYCVLCTIIVFIFVINVYLVNKLNKIGKYYYKHPIHIYDLGFKYLPNLHKYGYISDIVVVISLLSLFIPGICMKFVYLIIPIYLIRFITTNTTVLPKIEHCTIPDTLYSSFFGSCYDKIFSGHFAVVFLITLLLFEESYISLFLLFIINILNGLIIIATRQHYTIDVIVSFFITLFVHQFVKHNGRYMKFM
jgi:hypothetical protein